MFRKREDIEKDFIAYGAHESDPKPKSSPLGTLIQLLSVIVLLGMVTLMGMFGYKYWQKEFGEEAKKQENVSAAAVQTASSTTTVHAASNRSNQKLYTQEEMQAIISMLMEQMQHKETKQNMQAATEKIEKSDETERNKTSKPAIIEEETAELAAALENAQIDTIDTLDDTKHSEVLPEDVYTKTEAKIDEKPKNDTYNKVVIKPSTNSYDDLATLSKQISGIVNTMQAAKKGSNYTKSIKKEVAVRSSEMRVIIVQPGDTLSKIALRAYGSAMAYDKILEANPGLIKNPNNIYVGQRLRVPELNN
jgi:nucleoid-associated protein YgaU